MAGLAVGISGRVEVGETLRAVYPTSVVSVQWQSYVAGAWVNIGVAGSQTYTIPTGATGAVYRVVVSDGSLSAASAATGAVTLDSNKAGFAPTLTGVGFIAQAYESTPAEGLFSLLSFADADKSNYANGSLQVINSAFMPGGAANDTISLRFAGTASGQFSYNAATREVKYAFTAGSPVTVGLIDANQQGIGGDFKIVFNSNATKAVVDALIDNIRFLNTDDSPVAERVLTLRVTDGTGGSVQHALVLPVVNTPDAPVFASSAVFSIAENQALPVGVVSATDPDLESGEPQVMSYSLVAGAGDADNAHFHINGTSGALGFGDMPDYEQAGHAPVYSVRVRASDGNGGSTDQVITVTVLNVNEAPVVQALTATLGEYDAPVSLAAAFTDPDAGDSHAITLNASGTAGVVTRSGTNFTYDTAGRFESLAAGATATDVFSYTVTDAGGLSSTRVVSVTVVGANDVASISGPSTVAELQEDVNVQNGQLQTGGVLGIADADLGEARFVAQASVPGSLGLGRFSITESGAWTYTVDNTQVQHLRLGSNVAEYFVATSADGTASLPVFVVVYGTNDAPVAGGGVNAQVVEAGNLDSGVPVAGVAQAQGQLQAADVDAGDTLTWSGTASGTYGSFAVNAATGQWTYVLDNAGSATQALAEGQSATERFVATVIDSRGAAAQQEVLVAILGTNDAPVIAAGGGTTGAVQEPGSGGGTLVVDNGGTFVGEFSATPSSGGQLLILAGFDNGLGEMQQALARYQSDGSLDVSFGTGGRAPSSVQTPNDFATDAQGHHIVVGYNFTSYGTTRTDWAIERFNADGTPDTSFGQGGLVTLDFEGGYDYANSVRVLDSGKIMVMGDDLRFVRFNQDGTVDSGFGDAGRLDVASLGNYTDAMVDAFGRIVAWSVSQDPQSGATSLTIDRYLQTGNLDSSFGVQGHQSVALTSEVLHDAQVVLAPGGGILVGWSVRTAELFENQVSLARLSPGGLLDATWGGDGVVDLPYTAQWFGLTVDSQGRTLLDLSRHVDAGGRDVNLVRLGVDGGTDPTFGNNGLVTTDFNGGDDQVLSIKMDPGGYIVVNALTTDIAWNSDLAFASYNEDGSLNQAFGAPPAPVLSATGALGPGGDVDAGAVFSWSGSAAGVYGEFSVSPTGEWTYVLDPARPATEALAHGEQAVDQFVVTLTDNFGAIDTVDVVITVVGSYDPPAV